jgi:hypothetical protein
MTFELAGLATSAAPASKTNPQTTTKTDQFICSLIKSPFSDRANAVRHRMEPRIVRGDKGGAAVFPHTISNLSCHGLGCV